jgi:hypothetical protein
MEVVRAIHARPNQDEAIMPPVAIGQVRLIDPWPRVCGG